MLLDDTELFALTYEKLVEQLDKVVNVVIHHSIISVLCH
jgi:hypothetical protein